MSNKIQSAERVSHEDVSDNYVFQRSLLAYHQAAAIVSGDVLEVGTGSGYGAAIVSPAARTFVTVDKHDAGLDFSSLGNVSFRQMRVPPLRFADESFDYVISFQVIEHIRRDREMIREIHRVLRPAGRLVITTPNKKMSLTRNPWHVREYTAEEFGRLLGEFFPKVEGRGVFGRENVMEYYQNNKASVARVARYDILGFNRWLPRFLLRIPYDILNRMNRRRLLDADRTLTENIRMEDYFVDRADYGCFDLFFIAEK